MSGKSIPLPRVTEPFYKHLYTRNTIIDVADVRDHHARRAVILMERSQLEDKHLRLMEENLVRTGSSCVISRQ